MGASASPNVCEARIRRVQQTEIHLTQPAPGRESLDAVPRWQSSRDVEDSLPESAEFLRLRFRPARDQAANHPVRARHWQEGLLRRLAVRPAHGPFLQPGRRLG
jgi:hypothetical protein